MNMSVLLELSEPYEFGLEDNPSPLQAILRCIDVIDGSQCGIVRTRFKYKDRIYVHGFIRNRYGGDDIKLSTLVSLKELTVNTSFLQEDHPAEKFLEACDFSVIPNRGGPSTGLQIPWTEWSGFIGAIRIQE